MIIVTVEEQLKKIILERYKSVRAFTQDVNIPYSTVDTMFKRGISGTGVSTVIKIFQALNLDIESISTGELKSLTAKKAPAEQHGESDLQKERLIQNYDNMNQFGREKLVDYSDYLADDPKHAKNPTTILTKKQA